jgi:hypothetical protein
VPVIATFSGVLDGNGHVIRNVRIAGENDLGLFGLVLEAAQIRRLGVVDINVTSEGDRVGGLAGDSTRVVLNCDSTSAVSAARGFAGGLVGANGGYIGSCYGAGPVNGNGGSVGGLIGRHEVGCIASCYSTSTVHGGIGVGGLIGENVNTVANCFSTGAVSGTDQVGGCIGRNASGNVFNCYSTGRVAGWLSYGRVDRNDFARERRYHRLLLGHDDLARIVQRRGDRSAYRADAEEADIPIRRLGFRQHMDDLRRQGLPAPAMGKPAMSFAVASTKPFAARPAQKEGPADVIRQGLKKSWR